MNIYIDEDAMEGGQKTPHPKVRWIKTVIRIVLCIVVFVAFLVLCDRWGLIHKALE